MPGADRQHPFNDPGSECALIQINYIIERQMPPGFLPGRWQQSPKVERGEIFADMFIGWVYDRSETIDGTPDSPLREMGLDRKNYMNGIMIELIEIAMAHNKNR